MSRRPILAAMVLLLPGCPGWSATAGLRAWRWQRTVVATTPAEEQCVVLDGDLYARAAPGLRDLRIVQDGHDVPYALEESFDETALGNPGGDRALYTTVLQIPLHAWQPAPREAAEQPILTYRGEAVLAAHVPVERIELVPVPMGSSDTQRAPLALTVSATPLRQGAERPSPPSNSEVIHDVLPVGSPIDLTAIGANLQNAASVSVAVSSPRFSAAVLQMRQRLLCFRPAAGLPLRMVFGNERARPVRYDSMALHRPLAGSALAQLGPMESNPAYQNPVVGAPRWTRRRVVLLVCALGVAFALVTTLTLLPGRR